MGYRPYIDGLRALSVIAVVIYHLHLLPKPFATLGGFTGVDVFFVISGFLISKIVLNELDRGDFSFTAFYARRAKRILPAMMVMCSLTMICGLFLLHPLEFARLSRQFLAALGFVSNIYFYYTTDYFGPASSDLPLLHLWSLGIEEQFYLLLPAAMVLLARYSNRATIAVIVTLLTVSLIAAHIALARDPAAAFFLLPSRAFELLIGCLLALPTVRKSSNIHIATASGVAGLALLTYSFHFFRPTMQFPGIAALPACLGAALIIWSGESLASWPTRFVGCAPLVYIGKRSYSIYLYHWPVMFFVTRLFPDGSVNAILALTVTAAMSWLSYRFVEQPIRRATVSSLVSLKTAAAGIVVSAMAGVFVAATGGMSWRVDAQVNRYLSFLEYHNDAQFRAGSCFLSYLQSFQDLKETCIAPSSMPIAVLWGDSGAAQYASELDKAAAARGYQLRQITLSGCPPAIDLDVKDRPQCRQFNQRAIRRIIELRPSIVIMGAAWSDIWPVYDHAELTISQLNAAGLKVVVLGLGPSYKIPVPAILANRYKVNDPNLYSGDDLLRVWTLETDAMFQARVLQHPGTRYVSIIRTVCPNDQCPLLAEDTPAHSDLFHVTEPGSALFVKQFADQVFSSQHAAAPAQR